MITIVESHLRFNIEVNKLNSSFGKAFTSYEIDILLNQAQMAFLAEKLNNKQGNGVEYDNVIMNQLAPILIHKESYSPIGNRIVGDDLAYPVYEFIAFEIDGTKNNCTKRFKECKFFKHQIVVNETQQSNWKWGICNGYLASYDDQKTIILEPTDFTIPTVYVSYYKYPRVVSIGDYYDINENMTTTTEWTWTDDNTVIEIIKKAALLALESIQPTIETKALTDSMLN